LILRVLLRVSISFSTPPHPSARLGAELHELYGAVKFEDILARVEACLPKDAAGNFILEQEKSIRTRRSWPSIRLA
jgi:hypothetical protein